MSDALAIAIIELVIRYGPAAAITLIKGLETDNPTPEQIRSLKVEDPESYFGGSK